MIFCVRLTHTENHDILLLVIQGSTNCAYFSCNSKFTYQVGITCGAIDEASRSSKAIEKRIIINFHDKKAIIACFSVMIHISRYIMIYQDIS